ncbi:MAG: ester cyclase [Candidatus Bathyarchaeota archaeon]|nr:MAG: ester cyclase [Candidatus Bathyarchaeota archaeon]
MEENKAIIRKAVEAVNKRNLAMIDELIAPDYVDHTNPIGSPEDVKQFYTAIFEGFPDFRRTIEDILAEGDKVWIRTTVTGTHTGQFRGLAPTGKKIIIRTATIFRIVDGKIVESWSVNDFSDFYEQLGLGVF